MTIAIDSTYHGDVGAECACFALPEGATAIDVFNRGGSTLYVKLSGDCLACDDLAGAHCVPANSSRRFRVAGTVHVTGDGEFSIEVASGD